MPLNLRASNKRRNFDLAVSYKINETRDHLKDALNVFSNQGILKTRYGRSVFNLVAFGGPILSLSFFKNASGSRYLIVKVGTTLYAVDSSGATTTIKTGLSSTTKHRGVTWARGTSSRNIISIESDGLWQWDGTTFTQLGQNPPSSPTIATGSGSITNGTYRVYLTYYSSSTGFESNASGGSSTVTTTAQGINVSSIPTTATNATIDKVFIYLQNTASTDKRYVGQVNLGTSTFNIATDPTSSDTYPLANAAPLSGGGAYMTEFNRKLIYAGNSTYKNDVFFSEADLPDAFNDGNADGRLVLSPIYDGEITGIATGLYNNSVLDPYLVVFKKRSTHIYSEIGGESKFVPISKEIGCVAHNTITVKNGNVYFLSDQGWREISNGQISLDEMRNPATLGLGMIDDIFRQPGYVYEVNKEQLHNAFSVYYSALDQYLTWVPEGGSTELSKTYNFEFKIGGFKPYQFYSASTAACIGEDSSGNEVVFMSDANGMVYKHSVNEDVSDDDQSGVAQSIDSFAMMSWLDGDDMDASFNFRELILKRLSGGDDLVVKSWINDTLEDLEQFTYSFPSPDDGFVLDVSYLDVGVLGEERSKSRGRADINRCGLNILFGFYVNSIGQSIDLISAQLDYNRNGNSNI